MKFEIVGYSGHSYVVLDSLKGTNYNCVGYYDQEKKQNNPYELSFLGHENNKTTILPIFICIGDNLVRKSVAENLTKHPTISILNSSASVSPKASINSQLVFVGNSATINSMAFVDKGVIVNTNAVIEHEVSISQYSHIGPNATVCGGCNIGQNVFIGAGATIKQNVKIGDNCIIGAGTVVINDLNENCVYAGNPARLIKKL